MCEVHQPGVRAGQPVLRGDLHTGMAELYGLLHPARICDVCGKWLTGGYIKTLDGQRVCDDCYTTHDIEDD